MWLLLLSFCIGSLVAIFGAVIFKFSSGVLFVCWIIGFFSPGLIVLGKLYDKVTSDEKEDI